MVDVHVPVRAAGTDPVSRTATVDDLLIVAGEASGDTHAAEVLDELRRRVPQARAFGLGGDRLAAAGLERVASSSEISVVGITEALKVLPRARKIFKELLAEVDRRGARTALLVDFPEFNLRLAKELAERGVKIVYYVSPQVWAWRRGRVKTIARLVERMLVLFPFESEFYRQHDVEVVHVGHPLVDQVPELSPAALPERGRDAREIVLLPGSRPSEIRTHLPLMASAVELLRREGPLRARWILAPNVDPEEFSGRLPQDLGLETVVEGSFEAIASADLALCASGTATLEVGLLGTPMVVVYRVSALTYWLGRWLVDLPHISLVNLVLGREVVPELIQGEANGRRIAAVASTILRDPDRLATMRRDLGSLRERLGRPGASARAAAEVEAVLTGGQVHK